MSCRHHLTRAAWPWSPSCIPPRATTARTREQPLTELGRAYPLAVEYVDATSPSGLGLLAEHRVPMFPLVLVDGRFFSYGRLRRGKLGRLLAARQPAGTR